MPKRTAKKEAPDDNHLPVITCSKCGDDILLVPDAKLMGEAIEAHVEKHKSKAKTSVELENIEKIRDDLIAQVFDKAARE